MMWTVQIRTKNVAFGKVWGKMSVYAPKKQRQNGKSFKLTDFDEFIFEIARKCVINVYQISAYKFDMLF